MVIDLTGKTFPSASDNSCARCGADAGSDSGPCSPRFGSDEAELAHPLIQIETEEDSLSLDSSSARQKTVINKKMTKSMG